MLSSLESPAYRTDGNTDGHAFPYIDGPVDLPYQDSLRFFHYGSEHILEVLNSELKALKR